MSCNILIIDDEPDILDSFEIIANTLEEANFFLFNKYNSKVKEIINKNIIHLIILDLKPPNINGYDIYKELKLHPNIEGSYFILMSSEKKELIDRIKAYKAGCQEFLQKPFDLKEMELMLKSKINFFTRDSSLTKENIQIAGDFYIDTYKKEIFLLKEKLELTSMEYDLLNFFILNSERIFTTEELIQKIWKEPTNHENLRIFIHRLRSKIEKNNTVPNYIINKRNTGYIFYPNGITPLTKRI
ncbi:MAG: response regulator transcription factor [Candidatus Sericytochromatia bacterium]